MESREYEVLVAGVAESVARGVEELSEGAVQYGTKNLWMGASGFEHQIDVSIRGQERVLLVECKCWNNDRRVSTVTVLTLQGRLDDIRPTAGIVVEGAIISNNGFQPGAVKLAQHFGIHLDLVRSPEEFAFKYAGHFVVRPRPASAQASTSIGAIIIGGTSEGGASH